MERKESWKNPTNWEFCSSVCSVNLVFACCSCWSSGGGACCTDSQVSLLGRSLFRTTPCQGTWAQCKLLGVVLCDFSSLKALCATSEDEDKNGPTLISSPGTERLWPLSSVNPQGEAIFTFVCAKLCRLPQCPPTPLLPRGRGRQKVTVFLPFAGRLYREWSPDYTRVHDKPSWEPIPGLTGCSWFPCSNAWELCRLRHPVLSVTCDLRPPCPT